MNKLSLGMRPALAVAAIAALTGFSGTTAHAVEGGIGAYFLGTRDTLSGIVPPPGTYVSFTYQHLEGDVQGLSVGGLPIRADTDLELDLFWADITHVLDSTLWGGTPAVTLTIPYASPDLNFTAVSPPIAGAAIDDDTSGFADITVTGLVGWHRGNLHFNTGLSVYAPTGDYQTAKIDIPGRSIDALSVGKNVWSFQPFVAATWLNPDTGFEVSGAASLLFSIKNTDTDYQNAPAFQLEGAVVQRLPSGLGFGLSGYTYQQLSDDSGAGADQIKAALGASSLRAGVSGIGPILTYSKGKLSAKLKYTKEFGGKRRFEGEVVTAQVSYSF